MSAVVRWRAGCRLRHLLQPAGGNLALLAAAAGRGARAAEAWQIPSRPGAPAHRAACSLLLKSRPARLVFFRWCGLVNNATGYLEDNRTVVTCRVVAGESRAWHRAAFVV